MKKAKRLRCAIYTRKSTEEGLELEFNSLQAQREQCEAYIKSQVSEGWNAITKPYDDGGYSGGNLERPALMTLLSDIDAGAIDIVVVYKIDRLTRSLMDFAKIVERFERKSVSFVSITQSFNTTTSMGRLTLNVLLSFAQFEREVTSERIRDKIAASKRRGMWVGGPVPAGYDTVNKRLMINEIEAELVRSIFERYVKCRNLRTLERTLKADGVVSKVYVSRRGHKRGGVPYSCGALHHMLRNRTYRGEIPHKSEFLPGQHEAVIDKTLFDKAQAILAKNRWRRVDHPVTRERFPLKGLVFDDAGNRMSPVRQKAASGHRRYYTSQALLKGRKEKAGSIPRVPAGALEQFVSKTLDRLCSQPQVTDLARRKQVTAPVAVAADLRSMLGLIARIEVNAEVVVLCLHGVEMRQRFEHSPLGRKVATNVEALLRERLQSGEQVDVQNGLVRISVPGRLKFRGGEKVLVGSTLEQRPEVHIDRALVNAVLRAHRWRDLLETAQVQTTEQIAKREGITRAYVRAILPLAFLAPDLTTQLLDGRQPRALTVDRIVRLDLPLAWSEQRSMMSQLRQG